MRLLRRGVRRGGAVLSFAKMLCGSEINSFRLSSALSSAMNSNYDALLERLVGALREANLTQQDLSTLMGRSHTFLSKCESGERSLDVMELHQLADVYKKPVNQFLR